MRQRLQQLLTDLPTREKADESQASYLGIQGGSYQEQEISVTLGSAADAEG